MFINFIKSAIVKNFIIKYQDYKIIKFIKSNIIKNFKYIII